MSAPALDRSGFRLESAESLFQRAEALLCDRHIDAAVCAFDEAERNGAEPDGCSSGRWMACMLAGNFAAAWRESDAIRVRGADDPHRFWQGEPLEGKRVMVRCLHGLGDAVQMLRYLPLLRQCCMRTIVEVPPRLLQLAPCFSGVDEVITWGDAAPARCPTWDVQVEVMELPYLFRTQVVDLPVATSYLQLPPAVERRIAASMMYAGGLRVGIVWSASEWDPSRCLPMEAVACLTACTGLEWWNLQGGTKHDADLNHPALTGVRDAAQLGDGVLTLAGVIQQLDLVITVDTLAAHLAGALGKPAWVLLQHAADWRWMHARADSPWYPTLRLWRQPHAGDWHGMVQQVRATLDEWKQVIG